MGSSALLRALQVRSSLDIPDVLLLGAPRLPLQRERRPGTSGSSFGAVGREGLGRGRERAGATGVPAAATGVPAAAGAGRTPDACAPCSRRQGPRGGSAPRLRPAPSACVPGPSACVPARLRPHPGPTPPGLRGSWLPQPASGPQASFFRGSCSP